MDLELKIISATDLNKSSLFSSKLHPYVVVSISGTNLPPQKTPIDSDGGRNPTWNYPLRFSVPSDGDNLVLNFQIRSRRTLGSDKLVGDVRVPLTDLVRSSPSGNSPGNFISYQVNKPSGRPKGVLTFSYCITSKTSPGNTVMDFPVKPQTTSGMFPAPATGYPAMEGYKYDVYPPPVTTHSSYGYPTQGGLGYMYPTQTGYGYPTQTGYGYAQYQYGSGYGYGYGGPIVDPSRKKNGGLGLGAGLLGGAVAGMLIGDLVSDVAFD